MADQGAGGYRHRAVSFAAAALRDGSYSAHAQQELRAKVVQRVAELHAIDAVGTARLLRDSFPGQHEHIMLQLDGIPELQFLYLQAATRTRTLTLTLTLILALALLREARLALQLACQVVAHQLERDQLVRGRVRVRGKG